MKGKEKVVVSLDDNKFRSDLIKSLSVIAGHTSITQMLLVRHFEMFTGFKNLLTIRRGKPSNIP